MSNTTLKQRARPAVGYRAQAAVVVALVLLVATACGSQNPDEHGDVATSVAPATTATTSGVTANPAEVTTTTVAPEPATPTATSQPAIVSDELAPEMAVHLQLKTALPLIQADPAFGGIYVDYFGETFPRSDDPWQLVIQFVDDPVPHEAELRELGVTGPTVRVERVSHRKVALDAAAETIAQSIEDQQPWTVDSGLKYLYVDASTNSIVIYTSWQEPTPGFNRALLELEGRFGPGMFTLYPETVNEWVEDPDTSAWLRLDDEIDPLVSADPHYAGIYAGDFVGEPDPLNGGYGGIQEFVFQFTDDPQRHVDELLRFGLPPHLFKVEQVANTQIELFTAKEGVVAAYMAEEQWLIDSGFHSVWIEVVNDSDSNPDRGETNTVGVSSTLSEDSPEYLEAVRILESRFGPGIFTFIPDTEPMVFEDA
ncbi:MAG: hypothetical protein BMS9Abin07_0631 [Acidimicrobiia bacterium]|nr:MAG: hypothetical protein BMS9Abin07_0631 [Acidimicrobiia bacterium]